MRPLFRTRFRIEPPTAGERARFDTVRETGVRWITQHPATAGRLTPADFCEDTPSRTVHLKTEDTTVESSRAAVDGGLAWALRFCHPDADDGTVAWTTEFAIADIREPEGLDISCTVFVGLRDRSVRPVVRQPSRPRFLVELIQAFPCQADLRLTDRARPLRPKDTEALSRFLLDPKRRLPVVLVTTAGEAAAHSEAPKLASRLAGNAHVYVPTDTVVPPLLAQAPGMTWETVPRQGSIAIYWPGFDGVVSPALSRWYPTQVDLLRDRGGITQRIVGDVAAAALGLLDPDEPSWAKVEELARKARQDKAHGDGVEWSRYLQEEVDRLENELEIAKSSWKEAHERAAALERQCEGYRLSIETMQASKELHVQQQAPPESLEEAVERARTEFGDRLSFALNGASAVRGNPFERPEEALQALGWLAETWWAVKATGERPPDDLDKLLREHCGWQFRPSQSEGDMGKYKNEYQTIFNGAKLDLAHHLCSRSNKDARHSLRIAFAWHTELRRVVVGYIGQHQRSRKS